MRRPLRPFAVAAGGVALLASLSGCATTRISSAELDARARSSPIVAERDFHKKHVIVDGVVRQTSMTQRSSIVASGFYGHFTAEEQRDSVAVVVLEPGTVLCYFEPEEIAFAAEIKEGQRVRLDCTVDSFRVEGGQVLSVLAGCDRDR